METLQDIFAAIQANCSVARQVTLQLDEMMTRLEQALSTLSQLDDPYARTAEASVRSAQTNLRQAIAAWFDDYLRRSQELCQRITA
jgi:hypothetical protein